MSRILSRQFPFIVLVLGCLSPLVAQAACTSPAGIAGQFQYISSDYKYCDGTNWITMTVSNTGSACTTAGVLTKSGSDLRFCNGTNWISVNGATLASCAGTTAGTLAWRTSRMEWCDGTNWKVAGPSDPCQISPSPGTVCTGGAIYLGTLSTFKYMTTPGGCTNSATPTCAGGTDTLPKSWGAAGVTGINSTTNGPYNSSTLATNYSDTYAAKYCEDMTYGGYSDWFLPAKDELNIMNTNKASLSGLRTDGAKYYSSTEGSFSLTGFQRFNDGFQDFVDKSTSQLVRCVRRF